MTLPIHAVLPELLAGLAERSNAVLVAPPGAGKTTAVAPALLGESWCTGQILLLSPRRLAARAAAERMAEMIGEPVGKTVGYATRMDRKQSAATRILVLTEGIFRNRIQDDPELAGVSAVLLLYTVIVYVTVSPFLELAGPVFVTSITGANRLMLQVALSS